MNNVVNVSLNVPQSDVNFLNKLVEKMGWGMTQSQVTVSSPKDKVELAKRLYGCIQLPEGNASVIVTRNVKDFSHSPLLAKTPAEICEILQGYNFRDDSPTLVNEPAVPYGEEN